MDESHGPYFHGLGRKRKNASTDSESDEDSGNFFSRPDNDVSAMYGKRRRITHMEAEIIPKFDPGLKTANVKGWLHKIEQLGELHEWDDRDKIFVMQMRLRGAAREWYDDLEYYDSSWQQWKEQLSKAFPRSTEYIDRLEEMMARKKLESETMTKYYHDKISLLKKCNIDGEAAISCLIRGLPAEIRANAKAYSCDTPEELYFGFLSSLENYKKIQLDGSSSKSSWHRGAAAALPKTCYNCRRTGHDARDCRSTRCQFCQRMGHAAPACWFAASGSAPPPAPPPPSGQPSSRGAGAQSRSTVTQPQSASHQYSQSNRPGPDHYGDRRGTRQLQDGRVLALPPATN